MDKGSPLDLCCMVIAFPLLGAAAIFTGLKCIARGTWRSGDEPHCAKCDYNLTGAGSPVCPECGTPRQEQTLVRGESKVDAPIVLIGWLLCIVGAAVLLYCGLTVFRALSR